MSLTGLKLSQINGTQGPLKDTDLFYYVTQSPGPIFDSKKGDIKLVREYIDSTVGQTLRDEFILADSIVKTHSDTIVSQEEASRIAADALLTQAVLNEATARAEAILTETANRTSADADLVETISTESTNRATADAAIISSIADEVSARAVAETAIIASISSEATARLDADTKLTTDLSEEVSNRVAADNALTANVSTIQSSLVLKADLVSGKIPSAQLPSYVDDVIEVILYTDLPAEGEPGKIYVVKNTNLTYRWTGTDYIEISKSLAIGETSSTAYRGDHGLIAYDHTLVIAGNPHGTTKAHVGLGNVDNTSDLNKPISTATQTALDLKSNIPAPIKHTTTGDYNNITSRRALRLTDATDQPVTIDLAAIPKNSGIVLTITDISTNITDKLTTKTVKQLLVFKDTAGVVTEAAGTVGVSIAGQVVSVVYKGIAAKVIKTLITINVEALSEDNAVA